MLTLISHFSPVVLALIFVSAFALAGVVVLKLIALLLPSYHFETELGETFSDAVGVIFALLFAMVTVAVWQNHDRLDATVSNEANALHNLYRNLEHYPPAVRDHGQAKLKEYVQRVVTVEWPMLQGGHQDPVSHRLITDINKLLYSYKPASSGDVPLQTETLQQVTVYRGLRHDRLRGGEPYLDAIMWTALCLSAFIYLAYSCFYKTRVNHQYLLVVGTLGAALGLVFYMLVTYNYVFAGPGAISSKPLQELLEKYWVME